MYGLQLCHARHSHGGGVPVNSLSVDAVELGEHQGHLLVSGIILHEHLLILTQLACLVEPGVDLDASRLLTHLLPAHDFVFQLIKHCVVLVYLARRLFKLPDSDIFAGKRLLRGNL